MLTREQIIRAAEQRNRLTQALNDAAYRRPYDKAAERAHTEAARVWHNTRVATDYLWSKETRRKIESGDREAIEDALLFLEVDPWYFRSGYLKERLIDELKHAPLTEQDKARIREIIIAVAGGPNRREFRRFCRLAAKVTTEEFEQTIEQLARDHAADSSGKFSYLLRYLKQHRV